MIFLLTLVVTTAAIGATLVFCLLATENVGPLLPAALILLFVIGPYLALFGLAVMVRPSQWMSLVVLIATVVLAGGGISMFGVDCYQFHTDPEFARVQRLTVALVPLGQWLVVACISAVLVPLAVVARSKSRRLIERSE